MPRGWKIAGRLALSATRIKAVDEFVLSRDTQALLEGCGTKQLAAVLVGRFSDDLERLRALWRWLTAHVGFDIGAFRRAHRTAEAFDAGYDDENGDEAMLRRRRAESPRCLARIMHSCCRASGLRSFLVHGHARGWGARKYYEEDAPEREGSMTLNHSW